MTSQWKLQQHCHSQHGKNDGKAQLKKDIKAKSNTDYDCGYCSSKFSYDYALSRHLKEVHRFTDKNLVYAPMEALTFKCTECTSSFLRRSNLKRHKETVHAVTKLFVCSSCEKEFSRKNSYDRHFNNKICQKNST